ncbi:MAG TPA: ABC transporter permease, partial [Bryobacteraceae bacterium]|nr:ABC transporter permease [Bryobacteraceae bacterium]
MHWNDVRYALRLMRRNRGFTAVAVLSIALGIGANTAIFSLFDAVMVRTLPVSHPEQLVEFIQVYPGEPRGIGYWTWETYQHFRQHTRAFSDITGTSFDNVALVRTEDAEAEALVVENVLGNYFGMLGLKPAAGRLLGPDDVEVSGSGEAVVVSHSYWTTRLHGDRAAIGKRIWIGKNPKTIVGVAPSGYVGPRVGSRTDIWTAREKDNVALLGRLQPNATIEQARAEMHVLFPFAIEQRAARSNDPLVRKMRFELEHAGRGFARVRDQYGKPLTLLLAVVGLLLVLACINLAGLLLARSASRQRELAVRVGLGASSGQLIRQMLTESLLLSGTGAVIGILLAYAGTATLVRIIASGRAHERIELNIQPNLQVLLFTVFVAILTGIVFGLAPAWYASRFTPPNSSLRHSGRAGDAPIWRIFGRALVAVQVSLSILLVTSSAVFLTHLIRLRNFDLGFRSDHVLLIQLDPSGSGYKPGQLGTRYAQLLSQLRAIPGAQSAAIAACTPIQGCGASRFVSTQGFVERPEDRRFTTLSWVSPSYFETMGVPLLAGRD